MKKFVTRTLLFLSMIILIISAFYVFLWSTEKQETIKISKQNIVIGDSNTRWSVNDSILSNYANYSTGGETYLFAYTKLRLLDKDNKIDTILLSFNPHNTVNNMWWDDSTGSSIDNRMPMFFTDFTAEEHWDMFKEIPKNYLKSLMKIGKSQINPLFVIQNKPEDNMFRFGSYQPEKQNETMFKAVPYEYKKPQKTEIELKYLDKIVAECKRKNIHLILLQTPKNYLRKDYKNYNHQLFYDIYYSKYHDVDFLDFSKLELPKHAYWDVSHVDIIGAEYFSNFLKNQGVKNLLETQYNRKYDHR